MSAVSSRLQDNAVRKTTEAENALNIFLFIFIPVI